MTTANRATWKQAMGGTNTNTGRIGSSLAARDMPSHRAMKYRTKEQLGFGYGDDDEEEEDRNGILNDKGRKHLTREELKERLLLKEEQLLADRAHEKSNKYLNSNDKGLLTDPRKRMDSIKLLLDVPRQKEADNTILLLKEDGEKRFDEKGSVKEQESLHNNGKNSEEPIGISNNIKDKTFIMKQVEQYDDRDDEVYGDEDDENSDSNDDNEEEDDNDSSDYDSDSSDDDAAFLRLEMERIKREKEEKKIREEEERRKEEEEAKMEAMLKATNQSDSLEVNLTRFGSSQVKRKWRDDAIFTNQASDEPDEKKKRFINDPIRSDFHKSFLKKYVK